MKILSSFVLLFFSITAYTQNNKIDSLYNILQKTNKSEEKIDLLLDISKLYARINEDSSYKYSEKALTRSLILKDTIRTALSKQRISKIYSSQGKYKQSDILLKDAARLFKIKHDSLHYASVLSDISKNQKIEGDYNNALKNLIEARKVFQKLNNKHLEASTLNKIGTLYNSLKQYDKAIEYYKYALNIVADLDYKPAISALYINMGNVYSNMSESETDKTIRTGLCEKAEEYYKKALPIKREINDIKGIGICLLNIGLNNSRLENFKLAEEYLLQAVEYCKKTQNLTNLYTAYQNLAGNYLESNKIGKALKYAKLVSDAYKNNKFELGIKLKLENHFILSQIYKRQNKNKDAIFHYEKFTILKDSIFNTEKIKSVNELEIKYQTELKEKQNQILTKENDIQKLQIQKSNTRIYILFFSLLSAFFVIIIILLYIRQRQLKTKQKTVLLEQKLLRSQMNPHFIFNSLTAIQSYILKSKPGEGAKFLSKFAALIRIVLEHSRLEYVSVGKEIESLKYYLDLQKLRYEDYFQYEIIKDENIQQDNCFIPPMLAQPFIENAIEHGIAPSQKKGIIKVSFMNRIDNMIEFKVDDNGVGISDIKKNRNNESHHSLATQITKERLQLLNKNHKKKILLEVKEKTNKNNETEGVLTTFLIPYITNN
ncbi:MAG: tetratricopeptide repeat protein [Bacteroidales bacterium]|nr:tetratricopeptide repeat protein [Bacteroidales bacterium]